MEYGRVRVLKDLIAGLERGHAWIDQLDDAYAIEAQDEREFGLPVFFLLSLIDFAILNQRRSLQELGRFLFAEAAASAPRCRAYATPDGYT